MPLQNVGKVHRDIFEDGAVTGVSYPHIEPERSDSLFLLSTIEDQRDYYERLRGGRDFYSLEATIGGVAALGALFSGTVGEYNWPEVVAIVLGAPTAIHGLIQAVRRTPEVREAKPSPALVKRVEEIFSPVESRSKVKSRP